MRAKRINEIRRLVEPLPAIGTGRHAHNLTYNHISRRWPSVLKAPLLADKNEVQFACETMGCEKNELAKLYGYSNEAPDHPLTQAIDWLTHALAEADDVVVRKAEARGIQGWDNVMTYSPRLGASHIEIQMRGQRVVSFFLIRKMKDDPVNEIRREDRPSLSSLGVGRSHITALGWLKRNHPKFVRDFVVSFEDAIQLMLDDAPDDVKPDVENMRDAIVRNGGGTLSDYHAFDRFSDNVVEDQMADVDLLSGRQPHLYIQTVIRNRVSHELSAQRGNDDAEIWFVKYERHAVKKDLGLRDHYIVVMKDAKVNEIKKDGPALPAIGVGHSELYPACDAIVNNIPEPRHFTSRPHAQFIAVIEKLPQVFPDPELVGLIGIGSLRLFDEARQELYELVNYDPQEIKFNYDKKDVDVKYSATNKLARVDVTTYMSIDDSYDETFYLFACSPDHQEILR
jgi:hypothetical protein